MFRHFINLILYFLPPSRLFNLRRFLLNKSAISLGKNVSICGQGWIFGRGKLHIGDNTWVSPRVLFYTHSDAHISIGNNCDIGPGVNFVVGSHEVSTSSERRAGIGMARHPRHM